jgi:hypothetical protein
MNRILWASALLLSATTTAALAESVRPAESRSEVVNLTSAQMDSVKAGKITRHVENPGGNEPPGQQDNPNPPPQFDVENQNPSGHAPPGQNP